MGISQMRPCFSLFDTEKIDSKVSRSTVDLHFQNLLGCSTRSTKLFTVGTKLLAIIEAEKIDLKVSRSLVDLDLFGLLYCSTKSTDSLPVGINLLAIIGAEKIDFKVSRSKYFRSPK